MTDESVQTMVIMATVASKLCGEVVLPTAKSVVGTSLAAVSRLAKEGEQAAARYLRNGETAMRRIEEQGDVKFMDTRGSDLEAYRGDLKERGVRFNVERIEDGKVRLWYAASDAEKIKAAIIDAGARFVERDRKASEPDLSPERPTPAPADGSAREAPAEKALPPEPRGASPAQKPPTAEQNAAIAAMKSAGRIGQSVDPATVGEAHGVISRTLERESKGGAVGGRFASVQEAVAFIQGKNAFNAEASKAFERGAEKATKAIGEALER